MNGFVEICILGLVATAVMDGTGYARRRLFGVSGLDYALLGRWLGHMRHGQMTHVAIGCAAPIRGERSLGWVLHYLSGIFLAFGLWAGATRMGDWLLSLPGCLMYGVVTVLLPFLVLQPCFGLGVAASKTPHVWTARGRSLVSHLSFGVGLYLAVRLFGVLNAGS